MGAIVEEEGNKYYISAVIVGPSGYIGKHRKRHLTNEESVLLSYGMETDIYEINGCKIGVVICLEGWFPESTRELMIKGAQIVCHSMLTCQARTLDMMRIRAIENKAYVIIANSISTENHNNEFITLTRHS